MNKKEIKNTMKKLGVAAVDATKKVVTFTIETAEKGIKYYEAHQSAINKIAGLLVGAGIWRLGFGGRSSYDTRYMTRDERDRRFYDNRMGRYVYARRVPSNYEMQEIERRYRDGESYREILHSMGLLE